MNKYATTPQGQYHGPLPVRNFFPLPNILFDLGLTAEEIAVYNKFSAVLGVFRGL